MISSTLGQSWAKHHLSGDTCGQCPQWDLEERGPKRRARWNLWIFQMFSDSSHFFIMVQLHSTCTLHSFSPPTPVRGREKVGGDFVTFSGETWTNVCSFQIGYQNKPKKWFYSNLPEWTRKFIGVPNRLTGTWVRNISNSKAATLPKGTPQHGRCH